MSGATRAVRIRRDGGDSAASGPVAGDVRAAATAGPVGRRVPNSAGGNRAMRTFVFFVIALAAIYAGFLGYAVASSATGGTVSVSALLTASVAVALIVGWWVTLGQTPTVAWVERGSLVVRERTGRLRRFSTDDLRIHVLRTNPVSFLGAESTEFVEVANPGGPRRTYLVGDHYFDFAH